MTITSRKITAFTKKVADLPDKTSGAFTAAQAKAQFDAAPEELRVAHNALIDDLGATTAGDSGAKAIGVSPIAAVTGTNVQAVLEDLKLQVNGAVTGAIPPGSITQDKLAFAIAADASGVTIADTGAHFTATNVEGALDELFQSANSVKTNVSGAIGSPATVTDTGAQLASKITTEKERLAAEIGDGDSTSTLQYLADRLIVRSSDIATQVNAKGVPATSSDTLAQLATKVGQITSNNTKSVQSGVKITTLDTDTQAVTAINPAASLLFISFFNSANDGTVDKEAFYGVITSSTLLTFTRGAAGGSAQISWRLVEFSNVKSKQSGIYTMVNNANEQLVNITSVVPAKSILLAYPFGTTGTADLTSIFIKSRIASASQIGFQGGLNGINVRKMSWQLIEFN